MPNICHCLSPPKKVNFPVDSRASLSHKSLGHTTPLCLAVLFNLLSETQWGQDYSGITFSFLLHSSHFTRNFLTFKISKIAQNREETKSKGVLLHYFKSDFIINFDLLMEREKH